jgi:hypothetical protein
MNYINPHWIVVDIEPSIALARAECLEKFRKRPAQKPLAFDVMKDARAARSMYQRDLLRQFMTFLASCVSLARSPRHHGLNYPADLQPSASLASPRGV